MAHRNKFAILEKCVLVSAYESIAYANKVLGNLFFTKSDLGHVSKRLRNTGVYGEKFVFLKHQYVKT